MRLIKNLWNNLKTAIAMLLDSITGKYKGMSVLTIVGLVVALIYIFSPADCIFDSIPVLGLLDDAFILSLFVSSATRDFAAYKQWRENKIYQWET